MNRRCRQGPLISSTLNAVRLEANSTIDRNGSRRVSVVSKSICDPSQELLSASEHLALDHPVSFSSAHVPEALEPPDAGCEGHAAALSASSRKAATSTPVHTLHRCRALS